MWGCFKVPSINKLIEITGSTILGRMKMIY